MKQQKSGYILAKGAYRSVYQRADESEYYIHGGLRYSIPDRDLGRVVQNPPNCTKRLAPCKQSVKCTWKKGTGCRRKGTRVRMSRKKKSRSKSRSKSKSRSNRAYNSRGGIKKAYPLRSRR